MAKSSKRTKRPAALSGIPQRVLDLSPKDWSPEKRAKWCRAYLAGAADPTLPWPPRELKDFVLPFRQGQRSAASLTSEVAQVADVRRGDKVRRDRYEQDRQRAMASSRLDLLGRLQGLDRMMGTQRPGSPHDDPTILALAGAALGAGGMLIPSITRLED